jgi:hypothetical protein
MTFDWTQYTGNLKWLPERTLYLSRHGSHAYGTNEWREFKVVYRLVVRHLLGQLLGYPLGQTVSQSGSGRRPDGAEDLPFRDGAHAIHDSAHLGLPLYKILPDEKPVLLDGALLHLNAHLKGSAHRSELL